MAARRAASRVRWILLLFLPYLAVTSSSTVEPLQISFTETQRYEYSKVTVSAPANWEQAKEVCHENQMDLVNLELLQDEDTLHEAMQRDGVQSTFLGLQMIHVCMQHLHSSSVSPRSISCNENSQYVCADSWNGCSTDIQQASSWYEASHRCKSHYKYLPLDHTLQTCGLQEVDHLWVRDGEVQYWWVQGHYNQSPAYRVYHGIVHSVRMQTGEADHAYVVMSSDGNRFTTSLQDVMLTTFICQKLRTTGPAIRVTTQPPPPPPPQRNTSTTSTTTTTHQPLPQHHTVYSANGNHGEKKTTTTTAGLFHHNYNSHSDSSDENEKARRRLQGGVVAGAVAFFIILMIIILRICCCVRYDGSGNRSHRSRKIGLAQMIACFYRPVADTTASGEAETDPDGVGVDIPQNIQLTNPVRVAVVETVLTAHIIEYNPSTGVAIAVPERALSDTASARTITTDIPTLPSPPASPQRQKKKNKRKKRRRAPPEAIMIPA